MSYLCPHCGETDRVVKKTVQFLGTVWYCDDCGNEVTEVQDHE